MLFQAIITNEVPVTILSAFISIPLHIRNGVLIRQIIASYLCTAVSGPQQYCKEWKNFKRELCLNVIISFSITACCVVVR